LQELLRKAQKVYVRQHEKKEKQNLKPCCPQSGRSLKKKTLFRELGWDLLRNEGQTHKLQEERKRTDTTSVVIQDISNENILREGRRR
jgi:hypothetical protein